MNPARLIARSRCTEALEERHRRYVDIHRSLIAEVREARKKELLPIVDRMHAEADERRAA